MSRQTSRDNETSHDEPILSRVNRRRFLAGASLVAISALSALFGTRAEEPGEITDSTRAPGASPRPYGERSPFEKQVRLVGSASWTTPLQDPQGIMTPSDLHFERHHNGVPALIPSRHRLLVHGLVDRPMIFTVEELKRFPSVSRFAFLECSDNSRDGWDEAEDLTVQHLHGLMSTSEWTGIKLSTLLDAAEIRREAIWMLAG